MTIILAALLKQKTNGKKVFPGRKKFYTKSKYLENVRKAISSFITLRNEIFIRIQGCGSG